MISTHANGVINFTMGVDKFNTVMHPRGWYYTAYNCHNVFMNQMFRFSILVGGIFTLLLLVIILFAIKRNFSFTTLLIVIALLIPMCMDYSMTNIEFILFIPLIFLMFFKKSSPIEKTSFIN